VFFLGLARLVNRGRRRDARGETSLGGGRLRVGTRIEPRQEGVLERNASASGNINSSASLAGR
jgi:hypothetical protein